MVMDANQQQQPSPQSVGREFVRQYYTLLNKAPNHLHRFYNHNSSFIHDESTLYIGQKNIHNRIQQLNFNDCHAKISQVDSQATLGNGVVVQVTGELSNDGQPMRRFTQTFVLAAQSPKKYYVHNDIFRYQDVYSDEENDGESRSENDEEHEQRVTPVSAGLGAATTNDQQTQVPLAGEIPQQATHLQAATVVSTPTAAAVMAQPQQQPPAGPPQQFYISLPGAGGQAVSVIAAAAPPQGAVPLAAQFAATAPSGVSPQVQQAAAVPQLNGVMSHEEIPTGIMHQANQTNSVAAQTIVPQNASPVVAAVAGAPVIAAPHGIATVAVPVAAAAGVPPPNAATGIPAGFRAAPLMQQQILQQVPQPLQPQQPQQAPQIGPNTTHIQPAEFVPSNQVLAPSPTNEMPVEVVEENANQNVATNVNDTSSPAVPPPEPSVRQSPVVEDFKTITEQQQQEKLEQTKSQQQQNQHQNQSQQHNQQQQQQAPPPEPKTYANLFKSSSPGTYVNPSIQQQQQQHQQQQQQHQSGNSMYNSNSTITSSSYTSNNSNSYNNRNNNEGPSNMGSAGQNPLPQRNNQNRINKDFDQRRSSNSQPFGDNQQLFLGNIPHHAAEEDLKAMFSRFGTVLELRILSKPNSKAPPGVRNPLNYGFITYEDPESVQCCLSNCPLYFPEDSPDAQKLNVEEKKPRMRNDLPPRQGGGNNMNNNMNSQRNVGGAGHSSRSISNSSGNTGGGMMRGGSNNANSNSMSRGNSGGPRMGGAFNRNDNRNSSQMRGGGGNNNAQSGGSGGNYGRR